MNDPINHPAHYCGKIEAIDAIEFALGPQFTAYLHGSVLKYLLRANRKHESPIDCLKKARWYLNILIEELEK